MTLNLVKTLLVAGLTLATLSAKPHARTLPNINAEKTIRESVKLPAEIKTGGEKVEILFTTNQNGEVDFVLAKTSNSELKKEIEKQFHTLRFAGFKENAVNSVILNFKTL